MKSVNVSGLKINPYEALRMVQEDLVLVINRNEPDAVMNGLESAKIIGMPGASKTMATALFKDGNLSLARSAKLADMPLADFLAHVSRLGIPVIDLGIQKVDSVLFQIGLAFIIIVFKVAHEYKVFLFYSFGKEGQTWE